MLRTVLALFLMLLSFSPATAQLDVPEWRSPTSDLPPPPGPPPIEPGKPGACPQPKYQPWAGLFRNLSAVALYVSVPAYSQSAVECHEHMMDCINKRALSPAQRPEIEKELTEVYNNYPIPLHADELTNVMRHQIQQQIVPYIPRDKECHPVEIQVLKYHELKKFNKQPEALTVILKLELPRPNKPKIATLAIYYFRPGMDVKTMALTNEITSIPLHLPVSTIEQEVKEFVQRLFVAGGDGGPDMFPVDTP
jgi:hypothetical protein